MSIRKDCHALSEDIEKLLENEEMVLQKVSTGTIGIIRHKPSGQKIYMELTGIPRKEHVVYNILKLKEKIKRTYH